MNSSVAIVFGGGGGIGRAVALDLAQSGATVIVAEPGVSLSGEAVHDTRGSETVAMITSAGLAARHFPTSVTSSAEIAELVSCVLTEYGRIDTVVNMSGIVRTPRLADASQEDWQLVLDVHVNGWLNILREVLPVMIRQRFGRVVGASSGGGLARTSVEGVAYGAAKRAVASIVWNLGRLLPDGVTVSAISPIAVSRMIVGAQSPQGLDLSALPKATDMVPAIRLLLDGAHGQDLNGQVLFSAGRELALIKPPAMLEIVATPPNRDAAEHRAFLDQALANVLSAAESQQATTGGGVCRLSSPTPQTTPPEKSAARHIIIAHDGSRQAQVLREQLTSTGHMVLMLPLRQADFEIAPESALRSEAGARLEDTSLLVCVNAPPLPQESTDVLGELHTYSTLTQQIMEVAAWLRAAARVGLDRVILISPAWAPAGRTLAQSLTQSVRSATASPMDSQTTFFSIAVEGETQGAEQAAADLAILLLTSAKRTHLAGSELSAGDGWIGLRSHPAPAVSCTLQDPSAAHEVAKALTASIA